MALELGAFGIRVNCVNPTVVLTDMVLLLLFLNLIQLKFKILIVFIKFKREEKLGVTLKNLKKCLIEFL